jgi:hypothetical protein
LSFKIALLIDAENISYKDLPRIIETVGRHDRIVLRAVYGDWYKEDLYKWYEVAKANNFNIRHQTSTSKTKNSSDVSDPTPKGGGLCKQAMLTSLSRAEG